MAAAKVGETLLGGAVQKLFDYLTSKEFIDFFRGQKLDESLLMKLKVTMNALNKVLDDAESKQITNSEVKDWLDELKDVVYDIEDLVDEIATEALRYKVEAENPRGKKRLFDSLISTSNWLLGRGKNSKFGDMNSQLEKMVGMLDHFVRTKDALGLTEVAGQNWSQTRLPTTSLVNELCVYGRENDKGEIMKLLLSYGGSSNELDVIPIVGMGGLGKTTLAQLLYNDDILKDHFSLKSWVCVSDVFDVLRVTRTIVKAITGRASDKADLNSLQVNLKESLSGKKFLIVLDDVWNENPDHWDVLMAPFRFGARGSKIIVTTRNESVASIMNTVPIYVLKELPDEYCWKLFSKHAFENGDCDAHPNLEKIGKHISKKCKGLPLAAKTLGGLLRSQRDVRDWSNILESAIWELPKEKNNILPALRLSYRYLPSHLKRCFAFCSIFTKNYDFDIKELVSYWIAESFVQKPTNNKTVEEEGYECFRELLSRSFFQRSNTKKSCFVMHDLVHDLAQSVAGDFCYRLDDGKPRSIHEKKVRHFSYARCQFDSFDKFKVIKDAKCLRTFLHSHYTDYGKQWLSKKVLADILSGLTRLRLLSLPRYQINELPYSIGNLIHLRFLDLSYTLINHLPESVCTLYNLETLLLSDCHRLTTLPAELVKLISLRHLHLTRRNLTDMPMHMSRLKDLEQLTAFVVGKCSGYGINELKELDRLRGTISISGLQNVTSGNDAVQANLRQKKNLVKLALEWGSTSEDLQKEKDILEKLEPHTNLKHLEIKNYGGTEFPNWLGDQSFCNMVSLRLENCENSISLPPLGQLPYLKNLTIARMPKIRNIGHDFYGDQTGALSKHFQSLEYLCFEEMLEWEDWSILDAGEFSQLQKLEVIKCPKLTRDLPKKMPSLVILTIKECPKLVASQLETTSICELVLEECEGISFNLQRVSSLEKVTISGFRNLTRFTSGLLKLTNLEELKIKGCPGLLSLPEGMIRLNSLRELSVEWCREVVLPLSKEMNHYYAFLESLNLCGCDSLKSLPLGLFPMLRDLQIRHCENFETLLIPDGIEHQNPTVLEFLEICDCNNLVHFPCGGLPAPNLLHLTVWRCEKLKALPEQMHTLLPSLRQLYLGLCQAIESFPEGGLPSELRHLRIWKCKKLLGGWRDWGLQTLPSLTSFVLGGESEDMLESFPDEGVLPSTLTSLCILDLPSLKSLNNRGVQLLGSLQHMGIGNCPQLQSLPEEGLPTSLFALRIEDCPSLKHRCRRDEGGDWHKIAHVPLLHIDDEAIFDQVYLGQVDLFEIYVTDIWTWPAKARISAEILKSSILDRR